MEINKIKMNNIYMKYTLTIFFLNITFYFNNLEEKKNTKFNLAINLLNMSKNVEIQYNFFQLEKEYVQISNLN